MYIKRGENDWINVAKCWQLGLWKREYRQSLCYYGKLSIKTSKWISKWIVKEKKEYGIITNIEQIPRHIKWKKTHKVQKNVYYATLFLNKGDGWEYEHMYLCYESIFCYICRVHLETSETELKWFLIVGK